MIPMTRSGVNYITARSVYGGASGVTVGQIASGLMPGGAEVDGVTESAVLTGDGAVTSVSDHATASALGSTTLLGRPVTWWVILIVIVLGVMMVAKRYGGGEGGATFAAIKPSFYNMFAVTGNAVVGIVLLKLLFNRVQVPGLTALINAV